MGPSSPVRSTTVTTSGPTVADCLRLDSAQRRYEEDPYTGKWTSIASTRIIGRQSRFEVDLNRPRDKAVYVTPADAWGLEVWRCLPASEMVAESLREYDDFYAHLRFVLQRLVARHGKVVVFDLHSYNHIRGDAAGTPADPEGNPEVNLGTGTMDRTAWSPIVVSVARSNAVARLFGPSVGCAREREVFWRPIAAVDSRELSAYGLCAGNRSQEVFYERMDGRVGFDATSCSRTGAGGCGHGGWRCIGEDLA